jgi:cytoskeleton protein RodZ
MSSDHTLGKIMAAARERRGLTQSQSSAEANIPAYYLEMIESDDYSAIADQLYLLPFLRRYAIFIRLDPEEVASRFIRDVQRADMNATRMSDPIAMIERRRKSRSLPIAVIAVVAIAVLALVWLVYRLFFSGPSPEAPAPSAVASPTVQLAPQVPARPATVPPQVAVPQARPRPQTFPRNESLPSGSAAQGNLAPRTGVGSGAPVRPGYPPPAHPPLPPPEPDTE